MKFQNGAFCFYRASRVKPCDPDDIRQHAQAFGLPAALVPDYAGDRVTVGRAISALASPLQRQGWLLRPIKTHQSHVVYGIVRESKDQEREHVSHSHTATLEWSADHPEHLHERILTVSTNIGQGIDAEYQSRRGKIISADWTQTICAYLVNDCQAAQVRDDGRIYWIPPQSLVKAERLGQLLELVSIRLVLCEIESNSIETVKEAATDSLEAELEALQAEIAAFDGKQKPSTYAKRIDALDSLRRRALAYRGALGVTVTQYTGIIDGLDARTNELLDVRKKSTVHKNGSISTDTTPAMSF